MNAVRAHLPEDYYSDDLKSSLMLALALHCMILMIVFIVARILVPTVDPNAPLEILKASVRVDVVGMPKMTVQELKNLEANSTPPVADPKPVEASKTKAPEEVIKPDDVVMPEVAKEKPKALSSLLADYSSKKVPVKQVAKNGQDKGKAEGLDSLILEGNRLSKGTALVGDVSNAADAPYVAYVQTLPDSVRDHWRLPSFLKDKNLQCRLHIWIGANGQLLRVAVRESSGNADYDNRAQQAVRAAAPFSPPPAEVVQKMSSQGVVLGFPL